MQKTGRWKAYLIGAMAAIALCFTASDASAGRKFLTLGTAGTEGVYYPEGGTICKFVNSQGKEHGIRCVVESTGGSIYNLEAIRQNELDIGFAQSDWQANAYLGTNVFSDTGPNKDLRSLFSLHSEALTIVARNDKPIRSFDELKGFRVNIGNPGSGMRATLEELMHAKGWDNSVFRMATEYKAPMQVRKLCDNEIDAFVFATGHPNGLIQDATVCGTRIINVSGPAVQKLLQEHSYYAPATIPGGMYEGTPDDVHTFGVKATLVSSKNVDDELVYQVVRAVFENFDNFKTSHPILSTLDKRRMIANGLTAPLHDGALRYYREAGLIGEDGNVIRDDHAPTTSTYAPDVPESAGN